MTTKRASLVFFYFGDSYLTRLGQETVPVGKALEGYDRSVLLHFETKAGPFEVSKQDEKHATVVDTPTEAHFLEQLADLKKQDFEVDLWLFSHGSPGLFRVSKGEYGENTWARADHVSTHVEPMKLRAVWQCNCYGASWNETWRKLGAKVSAGARFVNFYPTRFSGFVNRWRDKGEGFGTAIDKSDTALVHTPAQAWILADAMSRLKEWNGTVLSAPTVLGENDASGRYFSTCWLGVDHDDQLSGKQNMNRSSRMLVEGDASLRF